MMLIEQFIDEYRWLSNFELVDIEYENIVYPSVEHFYQAMKINTSQMIDGKIFKTVKEAREYIASIKHPGIVKKLSKKFIIREDFDLMKKDIMYYALKIKYNYPLYKQLLLDTGDVYIQEGNNWNDVYWGVSLETGMGKNILGKMIMNIRKELKLS